MQAWAVYPAAQLLSLAEQELLGRMGTLQAWHRAAAIEARSITELLDVEKLTFPQLLHLW